MSKQKNNSGLTTYGTMLKVYISGPVTGVSDHESRFQKAEDLIFKIGDETKVCVMPVNPVKLLKDMAVKCSYGELMVLCFALLKECDAIMMLKGWSDSAGATLERRYAEVIGLHLLFEEDY